MSCPLCRRRPARRHCPAIAREICPVCCGTRRGVEIHCPESCAYLRVSRSHPPAVERRQAELDAGVLRPAVVGLDQRQVELLSVVFDRVASFTPEGFLHLTDGDLAACAEALASSYETAGRGLIYDRRPASASAARLGDDIRQAVGQLGERGWRTVERDAAVVLRRLEAAVKAAQTAGHGADPVLAAIGRAARSMAARPASSSPSREEGGGRSSLILP